MYQCDRDLQSLCSKFVCICYPLSMDTVGCVGGWPGYWYCEVQHTRTHTFKYTTLVHIKALHNTCNYRKQHPDEETTAVHHNLSPTMGGLTCRAPVLPPNTHTACVHICSDLVLCLCTGCSAPVVPDTVALNTTVQ